MYKVQRVYYETQEASDLGSYETMDEAKDRLVEAVEFAYEREHGLECEQVRKRTDKARRQGYYHFYDVDGMLSSIFTIQEDNRTSQANDCA